MSDETTIAEAPAPAPVAEAPAPAEAPPVTTAEGEQKPEAKPEEGEKKEKPWYEKELAKKQRRIDNLTRRLYETAPGLQSQPIGDTNRSQQDDSETLTLSRAEFERLRIEGAKELAPVIAQQQAAIERRTGVYQSLESRLGAEKFAELSRDLEDSLDGSLKDAKGAPKPLVDAIFDSEAPDLVLSYLADADNAAEVASLSKLPPLALGRAMAKLESKLAAKKAEEKPQPSKAAPVIEPVRGGGVPNAMPSDSDSIEVWMEKERKRMSKR